MVAAPQRATREKRPVGGKVNDFRAILITSGNGGPAAAAG
jgi:hypothetical protein